MVNERLKWIILKKRIITDTDKRYPEVNNSLEKV